MEIKQAIERIAKLGENDIGPTEENVKQKVIVPLLELLGHERENLEFEYRTRRGGKIDIFIKNVPPDCKVIIDTKNYKDNLNAYIEKIREYTFDEAALLAVIANGTEIRIYSPLRGVAFERSLLYCFKRQDLSKEPVWTILSGLLDNENLQNKNVIKKIEQREREIKDAMSNEESVIQEYDNKVERIDSNVETKEEEIKQLKIQKDTLAKEKESKISEIWKALGLPADLFIIRAPTFPIGRPTVTRPSEYSGKAKRVSLQKLANAGLVEEGQILSLFYNQPIDEQAQILVSSNKLKYTGDGKLYSPSELALKLLKEHKRISPDARAIRGPVHWQTEDGKLLHDLNEQVRQNTDIK